MAKYIKCDCCGNRIEFGATVYQFGGYCGLYCSPECFTDTQADIFTLDDDLAENCACTVFDDEQRKRELEEEIRKHERELEKPTNATRPLNNTKLTEVKEMATVKCNPNNSCVDCKNNGVNIKITNKCNCNCDFCIEKGGLITQEKSVDTLIVATNMLDYDNVLVLGGEPLMYEHLEEYLKGITNKKIYLTTNGTLLTDEMAEMLSKYLTAINISIHHFTEEENRKVYHNDKYTFQNIMSAIRIFNKNNVLVRINANLVKGILDTKKAVKRMIYFAQFMGANSIRFAEIQNCEELWVDSSTLFKDLPENPYVDGCEKVVYEEDDFKATVKMTCGFVNSLREKPNDPDRKQTERKVIYPDGKVLNGWYNIRDGVATYHGKEQPTRTVYEYVNSVQSCY